MINDRGEVNL